ncbi:hypothetical protein [Nocardioides massiliensis]|uniref:Uncharacterized protein n=1 Tax=Nocardioides massiliensis TaxID=1325935 RepID=A0ABT9NJY4_9ACTN|nr:hypothetical protein [Nocardioides massiliensis]MDP9820380.1 hypothetical protein [Nocardioides massiliensis]
MSSPEWVRDDYRLIEALEQAEAMECPGCHVPVELAWHAGMSGFFAKPDDAEVVCQSCTAIKGEQVSYRVGPQVVNTRPDSKGPLKPFEIGVTTARPEPPEKKPR